MNLYDKILSSSAQTGIPTIWCQIFAESLLKIESKLEITLDIVPREDKCLWIIILPSENYSKASSDNLDIVGFDYYEDLEEIYLITVVGFRNYWYNVNLYKKLLNNTDYVSQLENIYKNCRFDRQIRFKKFRANFYENINSYDTLSEYISDIFPSKYFEKSDIYDPYMTPAQCITKLNSLGVNSGDAIDKLNNWNHSDYNWLEYLHIVSKTPINCKLFLEREHKTIAEFEKQIEQQLSGMILIDNIFQSQFNAFELVNE